MDRLDPSQIALVFTMVIETSFTFTFTAISARRTTTGPVIQLTIPKQV